MAELRELKKARIDNDEPDFHPNIAIVGGGLSGLACALALHQSDVNGMINSITVYERDDFFSDRRQGFGLTLTNNPKGPLAKLGVLNDCIQYNCPSTCHYVFNSSGEILGYYGRAFKAGHEKEEEVYDSNQVGNLRIPRQILRQMLLNRLPPDTVKWGHKLLDYTENEDGAELIFEDKKIQVDLLIGADGFRSAVRQLQDLKSKNTKTCSEYMGICVILGLSYMKHPLISSRGFYVLDGTHRLFVMPFQTEVSETSSSQLTMWQLSFSGLNEDEAIKLNTYSPLKLRQYAQAKTSGWFSMVSEMIAATELSEVWCAALYDRPAMSPRKKYESSSVVVLGDACHPMSMFKGQGANQAIGDGPLLASWLLRPGLQRSNLNTRLRCFENEMISKTTPKVTASRKAAQYLHSSDCLQEDIGIEGIEDRDITKKVLATLREKGVGAGTSDYSDGEDLDTHVRNVISSVMHILQ